ncbi:DUF3592 domain-containing protein [Nocardia aurantiaca]
MSTKAARTGLRFARDGIVVPGRVVDIERSRRTVVDDEGSDTIEERSTPVVTYRTADGREMRESAIVAVVRTVATRQNGEFVANSQRGQWQGRSWELGEVVQVRYLSSEPERFRVEGRPNGHLLWFLPLSVSILCTAIGLALLVVGLI